MSNDRNTVVRALHDVGAASWFGGSLMGAVALNGASGDVSDPTERAKVASSGWARWSPVALASIAAHLIGGAGLVLANRQRVAHQPGVTANTIFKTAVTGLAMASTAYSGVLGGRIAAAGEVPAEGGTTPSASTPDEVATAQRQLKALQWLTPALTGVIVALGSQQGEQQKPSEILRGAARKAAMRTLKK